VVPWSESPREGPCRCLLDGCPLDGAHGGGFRSVATCGCPSHGMGWPWCCIDMCLTGYMLSSTSALLAIGLSGPNLVVPCNVVDMVWAGIVLCYSGHVCASHPLG
jgi:hypothetical protein